MPSNADIFQSSFLNGLSMATAQESGKLAAMQQAAQLQYGLQSKRMDFQLDLLKMQESQAARVVEMRMAQDEHQLKLKDYALRVEQSKMNSELLSIKMEEEKAATAAGSLYQQIAVSARNRGIVPGSPEAFQYADFVLGENETFNGGDPRVLARARAVHTQARESFVEESKKRGAAELAKLYDAQREPVYSPEGTVVGYKQVDDLYFRDKLESVAAAFRPAAKLGDSYAQEQLGLIQKKLAGIGTVGKPGVTPAAGAAGNLLSEYSPTRPLSGGLTGADTDAQIDQTIAARSRSEAARYTDTARAKLAAARDRFIEVGDAASAKVVADRMTKLDLLQQAVNEPSERVDRAVFPTEQGFLTGQGGQRLSYQQQTVYTPTKMDLWNLAQMDDPEAMVGEIDAILQRRQVVRDPDGKNLRRLALMY